MGFPAELVLVRHGICATHENQMPARDANDKRPLHTSLWPLLPSGVAQAAPAGEWLRSQGPIDRCITAAYVRCFEFAALIGQVAAPYAKWDVKDYLRARDRGPSDEHPLVSDGSSVAASEGHMLYSPLGGSRESKAELESRAALRLLDSIYRRATTSDRYLVVAPGEVIQMVDKAIKHLWGELFLQHSAEFGKVPQGGMIQYSLWGPDSAQHDNEAPSSFRWMRKILPEKSDSELEWEYRAEDWMEVPSFSLTNAQLLEYARRLSGQVS